MKRTIKRALAILMTLALAITALPMMEVKAAEEDIVLESLTLPYETITLDNENPSVFLADGAEMTLSGVAGEVYFIRAYFEGVTHEDGMEIHFYETDEANVYTGDVFVDGQGVSDTYQLLFLTIHYLDGTSTDIENGLRDVSYVLENNITDHTSPVIENIEFDQKGQTFVQGSDNVTIKITADLLDEGGTGIDLDSYGENTVTIKSVNGETSWLDFVEQNDGSYMATTSANRLSNTEWYISNIRVSDSASNMTEYFPISDGKYWNFFVEDENGVCDKEREITLNFYDLYGNFIDDRNLVISNGEVEFAAKLDDIPEYEGEYEFIGWKCDATGQMLEDGEIFISTEAGQEFYFYPVEEYRSVSVSLYYINEDMKFVELEPKTYVIAFDTTYQELFDLMPAAPAIEACEFVGWSVQNYELDDVVESFAVDLWATYDKRVIETYCIYMDEDGELMDEAVALIYDPDEELTYADVLADIPKYETYPGVTIVEWVLSDTDIELDQIIEDDWVQVYAYYDKYPVTIERTYIDTTGEGKKEIVTKLFPAGTRMANIYEEYTNPSDASTTIQIADWRIEEGYPEEISPFNNLLVIKAVYEEKVVVEVEYEYLSAFDDHGAYTTETMFAVVSKDIASDDAALLEYCEESVESKLDVTHYEACTFEGWEYYRIEDTDDDGFYDRVLVDANISFGDYIYVIALLDEYYEADLGVYVYAIEAGKVIDLPWTFNGKYLSWSIMDEDGATPLDGYVFEVPADAQIGQLIYLYSEYEDRLPGKADTSADIIDDNQVLPSNVTLKAILLEKGKIVDATKELVDAKLTNVRNYVVYDITLVNAAGLLIEELDKDIKVTLDLPITLGTDSTFAVYRVDDDKLVPCATTVDGDKVTFATDHFSTYVFVEHNTVPNTGDVTDVLPYMMLLILGISLCAFARKKYEY